ncbi:lactonase family protein [uncultured Bacteroides sp.]|uniref:lactonase family protein n=1 Tax=uncultured Bacteroides sp. TaxID=162156 RepID=UPI002AAB8F89|nr:lactonase family protein [uncultured Bacteroides sp.]
MLKKLMLMSISALILSSFTTKENIQKVTKDSDLYLLIGTYTSGTSKGIYVYRFNTETGEASYVNEVDGLSNPSYLNLSKDEKFVYSVGENEAEGGLAYALSFDKQNGKLTYLNEQQTHGGSPCYINIDPKGQHVITANYTGGNISVFKIKKDGALLPASQVITFDKEDSKEPQPASHLHCVAFSPEGKYLFADDLGKDKVHKFNLHYAEKENNSDQFLQAGDPSAFNIEKGSGPRHLTFHPNGKYAYLINELSGKVTVFEYKNGLLKDIQYIASDTTQEAVKKGSADIHLTPNGKYLYASNRLKADGIAIFKVNQLNGKLTKIGYQFTGIHPRNFIITPNGKLLLVACKNSNVIQVFRINYKNGLLEDTGKKIELDKPVCLKFASMK